MIIEHVQNVWSNSTGQHFQRKDGRDSEHYRRPADLWAGMNLSWKHVPEHHRRCARVPVLARVFSCCHAFDQTLLVHPFLWFWICVTWGFCLEDWISLNSFSMNKDSNKKMRQMIATAWYEVELFFSDVSKKQAVSKGAAGERMKQVVGVQCLLWQIGLRKN